MAWGLGQFGLLRLPWIEIHAVLPLTRAQGHAAVMLTGAPALPIDVTLACSGADVLALSQAALFSALHAGGAFAALAANVPAVRAWALAVPLVMAAGMRMHAVVEEPAIPRMPWWPRCASRGASGPAGPS